VCRPLHAHLLRGLEGIRLPLGPSTTIDSLDLHAPSAVAPPPPDLLHVASMSYLLDKVGWHGGACLNSSTRHDGLDAINRLRKTLVEGMCLEAATPAGRVAPHWPRGLHHLHRRTNPTPRTMATRVQHPQKTNQLPRVGSGATEKWAQRGPLSRARCTPLTPIYGHRRSAPEGLRRAWRSG